MTAESVELATEVERCAAQRLENFSRRFPSEPEIGISFSAGGNGGMVAEITVRIRGYRTLRATGKGDDAKSSLESAARKLEWKHRLFWARGSFRFSDCC